MEYEQGLTLMMMRFHLLGTSFQGRDGGGRDCHTRRRSSDRVWKSTGWWGQGGVGLGGPSGVKDWVSHARCGDKGLF
jgi:hypothetical protein